MSRVRINGVSLYYEIHGNGYPLLLIPGLNSDNATWAGIRKNLAKHFCVILLDNRSCGRSSYPDTKYSIRDMAADAISLLDCLKIGKCHIIGHSMGGYIALEMAIYYPERIGKLVLEATAPCFSKRNHTLLNDFLMRFEKERDNETLMRLWVCWLFSPKTFERKGYIASFIKNASIYRYFQPAKGFRSQFNAIASFDVCAKLKNIKAKTLIVTGKDDILFYPEESMKLVKGIKGSLFTQIAGAGHCVHVEHPGVFTSKVMKFLKQ